MNKTIAYAFFASFFILAILAGCTKTQTTSPVTGHSVSEDVASGNLRHLVLAIDGMYCASCGPGVAKLLSEIDGVVISRVSNAEDKGEFIYDADRISKERIVGTLQSPYSGTILADMPASEEMVNAVKALKND